jgi:hypothetical protein
MLSLKPKCGCGSSLCSVALESPGVCPARSAHRVALHTTVRRRVATRDGAPRAQRMQTASPSGASTAPVSFRDATTTSTALPRRCATYAIARVSTRSATRDTRNFRTGTNPRRSDTRVERCRTSCRRDRCHRRLRPNRRVRFHSWATMRDNPRCTTCTATCSSVCRAADPDTASRTSCRRSRANRIARPVPDGRSGNRAAATVPMSRRSYRQCPVMGQDHRIAWVRRQLSAVDAHEKDIALGTGLNPNRIQPVISASSSTAPRPFGTSRSVARGFGGHVLPSELLEHARTRGDGQSKADQALDLREVCALGGIAK